MSVNELRRKKQLVFCLQNKVCHGINRTGYLICRYLIEKLGWDPERAIREFRECRGHPIERQNYLQSLRSLRPKLDIEEDFENLDIC